jgi:hypothetical protein
MNALKLLLLVCLSGISFTLIAQQKTALHSNGTTSIFDGVSQFVNAYNAASDGDTIYLPGGLISQIPSIDKKLAIYGAGFHPDSTTATGSTVISSMAIESNADSTYITGIEFTSVLRISNNHDVDNLTISRCKMGSLEFDGGLTSPCDNAMVKECIITTIELNNAQYSTITNCIIEDRLYGGQYNAIHNNIFLTNGYYSTLTGVNNSSIANNIFLKQYVAYGIERYY